MTSEAAPETHAPDEWYTYRARPDPVSRYEQGVLDGDTYDLLIDTGFRQTYRPRVRSLYLDTAEIFGSHRESESYAAGIDQRDFVRAWFADSSATAARTRGHDDDWPLIVRSHPKNLTGKYGRWLVEVFDAEGSNLTDAVVGKFGEGVLYG